MAASPEPARQGALRGTLAVGLGEGISLPAAVVTAAVLARGLGPEAYGRFTVAATLVMTLEWILIAIFAKVTVKFVAEATDWRPVAATAFRAYLFSGMALGMALWASAGWVADVLNDPLLGGHLRLFAVEIPIFAGAIACRNVLAGTGRYRQQALTGAVRWLGRMTLIVLFVQLGWAVRGAILGSIGGVLMAFILGQAFIGRATWGRAGMPIRKFVDLAVPAFLLMLSARTFDQFGLLMLNALLGSGPQVGFYGAAQNISMASGLIAMTVTPILISTLGAAMREGDVARARDIAGGALRATLGLFPFAAIVAGSSVEIVVLLFGAAFVGAGPLVSWLAFVAVALVVISVAASLLIARGRPWPAVALTAPLLPLSIIGHFMLIPRFGALGAAMVTTATAALGAAACVVVALRVWEVRLPSGTLLRSVVLSLAGYAAASAWGAPGLLVVVKAAILSVGVLVGFFLLGELSRGELAGIRVMLAERRRRGSTPEDQRPPDHS